MQIKKQDYIELKVVWQTIVMVMIINTIIIFVVGRIQNDMVHNFAVFLGQKVNVFALIGGNVCVGFVFWQKKQYKMLSYLLLANIFITFGSTILKVVISDWLNLAIGYRPSGGERGFPSGHATHAYAVAFFVHLFLPKMRYIAYFLAVIITWARIETMVHDELQLMAGMFFGSVLSYLYWCLVLRKERL